MYDGPVLAGTTLFTAYLFFLKLIQHESKKFSTPKLIFPYFFVTKKFLPSEKKTK